MRFQFGPFILLNFLLIIFSISAFGQASNSGALVPGGPRLKLECGSCDYDYVKRSINFVNFVRDVYNADIYVKVTSQSTGNGSHYNIYFEGQHQYAGINDTLQVNTRSDDTRIERNNQLVESFKKGLLPYLLASPLRDRISYDLDMDIYDFGPRELEVSDPWNFWFFSISGRGSFSLESNHNSYSFRTGFYTTRKTEKSKFSLSYNNRYSEQNFYFRDDDNEIIDSLTINSHNKNQNLWAGYVHSLSDHWSFALTSNSFENSYANYNLSTKLEGGIEYNIYPYNESDRRMFVFTYQVGTSFLDYVETTVFDKTSEILYSHRFEAFISQNQKWGNLFVSADYFSYLHDVRLNRLSINPRISWKVFKGLTLELGSQLSFVNNQINLPKEDADIEDILLRDKLLATNYDFSTNMSIRYSFGSEFANIVNPRFWGRGG